MLITTTDVLQGVEIAEYLGVVAVRVPSAKAASFKGTYDKSAAAMMESLTNALIESASTIEADAIIGLRITPESMSTFATGTAVRLK